MHRLFHLATYHMVNAYLSRLSAVTGRTSCSKSLERKRIKEPPNGKASGNFQVSVWASFLGQLCDVKTSKNPWGHHQLDHRDPFDCLCLAPKDLHVARTFFRTKNPQSTSIGVLPVLLTKNPREFGTPTAAWVVLFLCFGAVLVVLVLFWLHVGGVLAVFWPYFVFWGGCGGEAGASNNI